MSRTYTHTQRNPLWWILLAIEIALIVLVWQHEETAVRVLATVIVSGLVLATASFATLTVRDAGDRLEVRFGPLPVFGTSVVYDDIRSVRRARSRWIDGWGIHWLPGRGWTFNIWGMDCVELTTARRRLRIGTDDPEGLERWLVDHTRSTR